MRHKTYDHDTGERVFKRPRVRKAGKDQEATIPSPPHIAGEQTGQYGPHYGNIDVSGEARVHIGDNICHYYTASRSHASRESASPIQRESRWRD